MKRGWMAGLAAAAVLTASAVQAQSTLRIGLNEDPDVLDPTLARTYVGRIVFASLCDKLFDVDEKLNIVPQLALSQETLDDGKTVILKLRPNVKFHDGEPMDADAVKFSLDRHMTMQGSFRKPELAAVDKVEVVDPLTVKLLLKAPFSPLLSQLTDRAGMIVSPKAAKEAGDKFGAKPVCAGPYKFVDRVQQDRITLERFPDYWNKDAIKIDRVVFQPITDTTVKLANLKAGQLDLIERPAATDLQEIRSNPNLKLVTVTDLGFQGMWINTNKGDAAKGPLGQDARVRQALDLAIDREALNQVVFNGEYVPGNQWVSPENPYYQSKFPVPKRDVAKAKQLLQQVGVKTPLAVDFMVGNSTESEGERRGHPGDGGRSRVRHEDPHRRVRDVAQGGGGRALPSLSAQLVRPHGSRRQPLHLHEDGSAAELRRVFEPRGRQAPRRSASQKRPEGTQGDL